MEYLSDKLFKYIYKIYFTTVLLIFKKHNLPKCIGRYIIEGFFEKNIIDRYYFKAIRANIFDINDSKSHTQTEEFLYKFYFSHHYFYVKFFNISSKCLITNFDKFYIDNKFSADSRYSVYELNPYIPSEYMISYIKLLILCKNQIIFDKKKLTIPIFSFFKMEIVQHILDNNADHISKYLIKEYQLAQNITWMKDLKKKIENLKEELKNF